MAPPRYERVRTPEKPRRLKLLNASSKNFKGQLLNRQVQLVVYNVYKYMRREKLRGGLLRPVRQLR